MSRLRSSKSVHDSERVTGSFIQPSLTGGEIGEVAFLDVRHLGNIDIALFRDQHVTSTQLPRCYSYKGQLHFFKSRGDSCAGCNRPVPADDKVL